MSIKVFISWSGNAGKFVAHHLQELIESICPAIAPWTSNKDLTPGTLWHNELMEELKSTNLGIICINRESLNSRWLHFEAGAIAKSISFSRVYPYLIDLPSSDLSGPLAQFQSVSADKEGTFKLVSALNTLLRDSSETSHTDERLLSVFNNMWDEYAGNLKQAPAVPMNAGPERSDTEILGELLDYARMHTRVLHSLLRPSPSTRGPIQTNNKSALPGKSMLSDEDLQRMSFDEFRFEALNQRSNGQFQEALDLFNEALSLRPNDLETQIDIAVTETYLSNVVYKESVEKLERMVREEVEKRDVASYKVKSIIAKAYYNLACIKVVAREEQNESYSYEDILGNLEYAFIMYPIYIKVATDDLDLAKLRADKRFEELIEKYKE